jgi:hypothetical protein
MYKLKKFHQFFAINEQESSKEAGDAVKSGVVSIIKNAFKAKGIDVGEGTESDLDKASEYQSAPYNGCGASAPYSSNGIKEMELVPNAGGFFTMGKSRVAAMLQVLNEKGKGDYKRAISELKEGKAILIGVRRKFTERKPNDDLFCDFIGATKKAEDPDKQARFFPGTTCPSLAFYGNKPLNEKGVGIKAPGDTLYILGEWKPPSGKIPAYKALKEGEPVNIYRYPKGITSYEKGGSYKPGQIMKEPTGMHVHRSSTGNVEGICVGPWSAGCQVLSKGDNFDALISRCEESGQDKFIYALVQEDDYLEFKAEIDKMREKIKNEQPSVASSTPPKEEKKA